MWLSLLLIVLEIVAKLPQIESAIKAIIELIRNRDKTEKLVHARRLRKTIRAFLANKKSAGDTLTEVQDQLAELQTVA